MSKKEIQQKELNAVLAKDIGAKNPIFSPDHITELHALFSLYADPRQRRADIREFLMTAGTLGLDHKYEFVFRLLHEINEGTNGNALDFEQFLKELTARIVYFDWFREAHSLRTEEELISPYWTSKVKENSISMIWDTLTSNSNTDILMINLLKSSTLLEVMELRPSHGRNSTNSSKEKLIEEDSLFDLAHLLT